MALAVLRRSLAPLTGLGALAALAPVAARAQQAGARATEPTASTRAGRAATDSASRTRNQTATTKTAATETAATKAAAGRPGASPRAPKPAPVWPVAGPEPLPGAVLPAKRIVAYYGNPLSKRMGILGELPPDEMLARLDREVRRWSAADPSTPVQPAQHLIVVVAQADPGREGMYRLRMRDSLIERVYGWAQRKKALLFLDVQVGKSTLQAELPRLAPFLQRPDVHLGLDPEFSMKTGKAPGKVIGTMDAADINYASGFLAGLVSAHKLPPKVLVVHRFTRDMLTRSNKIELDPRVQVVIIMDGCVGPELKRKSYDAYEYG